LRLASNLSLADATVHACIHDRLHHNQHRTALVRMHPTKRGGKDEYYVFCLPCGSKPEPTDAEPTGATSGENSTGSGATETTTRSREQ